MFLDGLPAHLEMALDLANGPVFGPVKSMQVIDLVSRQHGSSCLSSRTVVSRPEGCCLQGGGARSRDGASASITNTWEGAELLFARNSAPAPTSQTAAAECFRSRAEVLLARLRRCRSDHGTSAAGDSGQPLRDVACGNAPSNPDGRLAIFGAVAANLAVLRIGGNLVSVVFGSTLSLACQFAADQLARLKLGKLKGFLAIAAAPFRRSRCRIPCMGGTGGDRPLPSRFRNCCRVHTASAPMSSLRTATKPGKLRVF